MRKLLIAAACYLAVINPSFALTYEEIEELRMLTRQYVNARAIERGQAISPSSGNSYQYNKYVLPSSPTSRLTTEIPPINTYNYHGHQIRCQTFPNMLGDITYCN